MKIIFFKPPSSQWFINLLIDGRIPLQVIKPGEKLMLICWPSKELLTMNANIKCKMKDENDSSVLSHAIVTIFFKLIFTDTLRH